MNQPILLKPDDVSSHLVCAICLNVPLDPALTPCQHLFCQACLAKHRETRGPDCPTCRTQNSRINKLESGTILYRIWSETPVKCCNCERGCPWAGHVVDAQRHMTACSFADNSAKLKQEHQKLKAECQKLKNQVDQFKTNYDNVVAQLNAANQTIGSLRNEADALRAEKDKAQQKIANLKNGSNGQVLVPSLFSGDYYFNRFSVIKLSQLIARYIETGPQNPMNHNRVYNCVRSCYHDLERGYNDNPPNYRLHVQMLLSTCLSSSGWFTDNQMNSIERWMSLQGWD